jgi:hypothetical protein
LEFNRFDVSTKEGVQAVKDSTTYQKILRDGRAEGHIEEARRIVLRQGTKRFGEPEAAILAALEDLGLRILDADIRDWNDWLGLA